MKYLDKQGLDSLLEMLYNYIDSKVSSSGGSSSGGSSSGLDFYSSVPKTAAAHNAIYRGKDITNLLTDGSIKSMIQNGTYDDIFIGDYFNISGTYCSMYRVMGLDYCKNQYGDHIMAVVPDVCTFEYDSGNVYTQNIKTLYNTINTTVSKYPAIRIAEIGKSTQPTIVMAPASAYGIASSSNSNISYNLILPGVVLNPQLIYAGYSSSSQTYAYQVNENGGVPDKLVLVDRYGEATRNASVTSIDRIRPIIPITSAF